MANRKSGQRSAIAARPRNTASWPVVAAVTLASALAMAPLAWAVSGPSGGVVLASGAAVLLAAPAVARGLLKAVRSGRPGSGDTVGGSSSGQPAAAGLADCMVPMVARMGLALALCLAVVGLAGPEGRSAVLWLVPLYLTALAAETVSLARALSTCSLPGAYPPRP